MAAAHNADPSAFAVRATDAQLVSAAKLAREVEHADVRERAKAIARRLGWTSDTERVVDACGGDVALERAVLFEAECVDPDDGRDWADE